MQTASALLITLTGALLLIGCGESAAAPSWDRPQGTAGETSSVTREYG